MMTIDDDDDDDDDDHDDNGNELVGPSAPPSSTSPINLTMLPCGATPLKY